MKRQTKTKGRRDAPSRTTGSMAYASLLLWVGSLFLPAVDIHNRMAPEMLPGVVLFMSAWILVMLGDLAWYANPMLFYVLVRYASGRDVAPALAGAPIALAAMSLLPFKVELISGPAHISAYRIGFFVWMAAMVLPLAWSIRHRIKLERVIRYYGDDDPRRQDESVDPPGDLMTVRWP